MSPTSKAVETNDPLFTDEFRERLVLTNQSGWERLLKRGSRGVYEDLKDGDLLRKYKFCFEQTTNLRQEVTAYGKEHYEPKPVIVSTPDRERERELVLV